MDPPVCFGCKQVCVIRISKAKNRNYGRRFWACQSSLRGGTCVRWNGWIDPLVERSDNIRDSILCSVCNKSVKVNDEVEKNIKELSGLILDHQPLCELIKKDMMGEMEKGSYVCFSCAQ
jgi:hypothetical protein